MNKHKAMGSGKWKQLRLRILARDGYECGYCGGVADSVDHIVSRASGGAMWDAENLIACCKPCNSRKGDRPASKRVFLGTESTPPVFSDSSLPETVSVFPDSPFQSQSSLEQ